MKLNITAIDIRVPVGRMSLPGMLTVPPGAAGLVIFAHGSGSSRFSPRNVAVAHDLVERGCATLLIDLLSPDEAEDRANVFDIDLLGSRVSHVARWSRERCRETRSLPIGLFGASTGAAAALVAAAELGDLIAAVVSRGGRPDLAGTSLALVTAPTLLIVGSLDEPVIILNEQAKRQMRCERELVIVEGASHLFEEPRTLEEVSRLAGEWFTRWFVLARR